MPATFVLSGLRLDRSQVRTIFQGVRVMRESDTYQAILDGRNGSGAPVAGFPAGPAGCLVAREAIRLSGGGSG